MYFPARGRGLPSGVGLTPFPGCLCQYEVGAFLRRLDQRHVLGGHPGIMSVSFIGCVVGAMSYVFIPV